MNNTNTFEPFSKIPRLKRDCVITEKIDGTNAQIYITPETPEPEMLPDIPWVASIGNVRIAAGSRNRWITPDNDNYGFAGWVQRNAEELVKLGPGRHFGEWWGAGIQRRYGLTEKRFSLFNVERWAYWAERPACCSIVPTLYRGEFDTAQINATLALLSAAGSQAAPGFMDPEGIIIYHAASRMLFKQTIKDDAVPKTFVGSPGGGPSIAQQCAPGAVEAAREALNQRFDSAAERSNTTL